MTVSAISVIKMHCLALLDILLLNIIVSEPFSEFKIPTFKVSPEYLMMLLTQSLILF